MEKIGYIEIKVTGKKGNLDLTPDNFDVKELVSVIEQAEKLLFPGDKKERPIITYSMEEGSVRNIFRTSMQAVIGFSALLLQIQSSQNINFLELSTSKAIEFLQENAVRMDYTFEISTSQSQNHKLRIDSSTNFYRSREHWSEAELYFYGKITNAGGKEKSNIHLVVDTLGTVIIQTPKKFLAEREENLLYKTFGIRAKGMQNTETGEIDRNSLTFIELIDYSKNYDEVYLRNLRNKAKNWLENISPDKWLNDIRGYDA